MNLFLLGVNTPAEYFYKAVEQAKCYSNIYPNLCNGNKYVYKTEDLRNFIIILSKSSEILGNRDFLTEDKDYILFYNGIPIDPSNKIRAHKASEVLSRFDDIKYSFEGQASIIRFNKHTNDVDVITDNLGMEQVYYYKNNGEFLLSNNIQFIENVTGSHELDTDGASLFISLGWVAGDYTLRKGIKVIKGGQHWKWNADKHALDKSTYFDVSEIQPCAKPNPKEILNKENIKRVYEELVKYPSILEDYFDLECPLTGGFDSRLVASILISKNIKADYYTIGNSEHKDARIAMLIAGKFGLPYKTYPIDYENLFENWDSILKKYIQQNNGLASLWSMNGIFTHFDQMNASANKLTIRLATEGAEATRTTYDNPDFLAKNVPQSVVHNYLSTRCVQNPYNILSNNSIEVSRSFIDLFFNTLIQKGVDSKFIPGLLYLLEHVGRFHANNRGIYKNVSDTFSMFLTKNYLITGARLHPIDRAAYPVHFKMMKMLNKELFELPNIHGNWPLRNPRVKIFLGKIYPVLKKPLRVLKSGLHPKKEVNELKVHKNGVEIFDRRRIFDTKLNEIKNVCLDQSSSEIWQLIKKDNLEKVLSDKNGIDNKSLRQLYAVTTLFYYEHFSRS